MGKYNTRNKHYNKAKAGSDKKKAKKKMLQIESTQSASPIYDVQDGVIITKDGRFIKILEFDPINFLLRSAKERNAIADIFAVASKIMPVKVQYKIMCRKANVANYVNQISMDIAVEENEQCIKLQEEQIELITKLGEQQGISRRFFLIFEHETFANHKLTFVQIKNEMNTVAQRIKNHLYQCGNECLSNDTDEYVLSVLYDCLSRKESEQRPFEDRKLETYLRYTGKNEEGGFIPVNDYIAPRLINTEESYKYIVIDGLCYAYAYIPSHSYPLRSYAGWLALLINIGEGVDVDFFVHKQPVESTQRKLQFAIRHNKQRAKTMEDTSIEYEDLVGAINSGYYLKQGLSSGDDFCYMSTLLTVIARSKEELDWKRKEIKSHLLANDLKLRWCNFRHEDAWHSSLPLVSLSDSIYKKARRNVLSSALASAYPFVSFEISDNNGVFFGINKSNGSLAFIDNFDSSIYSNANMAILGTSGAGKTYTLQDIALRMRQKQQQVFIIAPVKGHEFKRACDNIGGQYIRISAGSRHCINVMEIRKRDTTIADILDGASTESILLQKIQQLHTFFSLLIPDLSNEERQLLDEAVMRTYHQFHITENNDSLYDPEDRQRYRKMPILSDLHRQLEMSGDGTKRLYNILTRYVSGSAKAFNGETNVDLNNKYIVLDVSGLSKEMLTIGMFIAVDYVWDKSREDRTQRKAIFLDELWELIGAKGSREAAEFVLEIFKVIRGYGGAAIAATQDLNDFFALEDGRYGKGIINNAKIKIVMKLEADEAERVRDTLKLSDTEIESIKKFEPGSSLFIANSNHVLIDFKATKSENDLITTNPAEQRRIALEMQKLENSNKTA